MLPLGRGLAIAKAICRGLAVAHKIGVLHRDLKPENVIVAADDTPRLMDFGIAVETALYRGEKEDTVPGTPQFLAPELLRGEAPSVRTDIYAMGVLLYEMFTGQVPFDDPGHGATRAPRDHRGAVRRRRRCGRTCRRTCSESSTGPSPRIPRRVSPTRTRSPTRSRPSREKSSNGCSPRFPSRGPRWSSSWSSSKRTRRWPPLSIRPRSCGSFCAPRPPRPTPSGERSSCASPAATSSSSQILEGGAVDPIRLPVGRGIAGTVAKTGEIINITDAYKDPRFDSRTDATSGFTTRTILAAPLRTPKGEIVGVVEILNKRQRVFTKEDEEFLAEVGTHSALAVESVRQHEAAVQRRAAGGRGGGPEGGAAVSAPRAPGRTTPGFESAPLRWQVGAS